MRIDLEPQARVRYGAPRRTVATTALAFVGCCVLYNAGLAALNAIGVHQTFASVALTEVTIIAASAVYIAASGLRIADPASPRIIVFGTLIAIYVSFASQALALDCARATAIIGLFSILGYATTERQIFALFRILSIIVLIFLLLEIFDTALYVRCFQPAAYYSATRGIEEFSLDDSGLFRNSLGFQGRFSFGISSHRTASVFIEQVSLANFSGILIIYLLACFDRLVRFDRVLHVGTVVLILLSNDSRTSSIFALVSLIGAYAFPRLPPRGCFLVMPIVLLAGFCLVQWLGFSHSDDLQGRVSVTMFNLSNLDWSDWIGFGGRYLGSFMDSGYAYIVSGSSIFGLLILWLLLATAVPTNTAPRRRCLYGLNIYMCSNLMIGGTAVFSIKIAAPLWLLIGYMSAHRGLQDRRRATPIETVREAATLRAT